MKWEYFHHPDICLPVIAKSVMEETAFILAGIGTILMTRGWSLANDNLYYSRNAFRTAKSRLAKQGLIVQGVDKATGLPSITFVGQNQYKDKAILHPEKYWSRKWKRRWYVLIYDVPEANRPYRDTLRKFLKRLRMGKLQRSVWISPVDIRPQYHHMMEAIGIDDVAVLLESRTVLGQSDRELIRRAWDMDRLCSWQKHFIKVSSQCCGDILNDRMNVEQTAAYLKEHVHAYRAIFSNDPLLPESLWPDAYRGRDMVSWYMYTLETINAFLKSHA